MIILFGCSQVENSNVDEPKQNSEKVTKIKQDIVKEIEGKSNDNEIKVSDEIEKSYSTLKEYYENISYSCEIDSDCEKNDIRSCCGYYPECVSLSTIIDPSFIKIACEKGDAPHRSGKYPPNQCLQMRK